jgi:TP901 family phage tail tape measure protein
MAEEQIVTHIVANADFSNLIADVNRVTASLSEMQQKLASSNKALGNQIKVINNSFSETLRSTGQYSTHFLTLTSDVDKFGRNLDAGRLKLKDYFRVYQDHQKTSSGLIRDLAKQQTQLQNAVLQPLGRNAQGLMQFNVHVPRGLDLIKNKTGLARLELQIMNKVIQDGAVQLINWGKNTQWAGRQLTVGLTVPLAMFGKAAAEAFKVADQELTRLTKVYGDVAGTSAEELSQIRKEVAETAKQLASSFGVNFSETIALAADIAATGKTGNELLGALTETTRLAVLGEVDRGEAMKATLAIQTAFKQNTEELTQSINFLNAVENQTSTTLNDLVTAIPKAGPVVKSLGGDIKDLALYLTAMREGGINASESANALKSGLASLINPTKQSVGVMSDFGIDILGMVQKNAGNTTSLLLDLQGALDNLDPLQKAQAIEQLFGKFQFARISALLGNLGKEGSQTLQVLDLMKESASSLEDVAGRELSAVTESAAGKYRRAIEGLKADLAGVGEQFLNISTNLINFVDGIVDFANKLPKPIKQALALVGGITAIAGPLIMLTGVLANFFGYIIKGLSHMRALFKGGEGFRLLTPEILAAERAGSLIEKTFYNDAQAASVLNTALKNLIDSFTVLQSKAAAGQFSVGSQISTMAGNLTVASSAAGRVVDPNNPFLGPMGTRASAHMNPRDPGNPASLFGMVPSTGPVNLKVGKNPMFYAGGDLPAIQGLTSYGGASAGIYAPEAARWHSLMATMGMQTRQEMEELKNIIATGGSVSSDIMNTFDDILPLMSNVTDSAAQQTQLIVSEMQAGKIAIAEARTRIMQLNAQVEAELIATAQTFAASRGRSIDVTRVPGLDQPVVGLTGSSNMRELFHKERSRRMMEALGRATRTRTFGGGYNIATTRSSGLLLPPGYNKGGEVYSLNQGNIVPGPNINADVVPAMLTPGEFVVNRKATAQNLPLLQAINGSGSTGPGFNTGSQGAVRYQRGHAGRRLDPLGLSISDLAPKTKGISYVAEGIPLWMSETMNQELRSGRPGLTGAQIHSEIVNGLRNGRHPFEPLFTIARQQGIPGEEARLNNIFRDMMKDLSGPKASIKFSASGNSFENYFDSRYVPRLGTSMQRIWRSYGTAYGPRSNRSLVGLGTVHIDPKTGRMSPIRGTGNPLSGGMPLGILGSYSGSGYSSSKSRTGLSSALSRAALRIVTRGRGFNAGGLVPGYRAGGIVGKNRNYYGEYFKDPNSGLILPTSLTTSSASQPQLLKTHGPTFFGMKDMVEGKTGGVPLRPNMSRSPMMANLLSMGAGMGGGTLGQKFGGGLGSLVGFIAAQSAASALLNRNMNTSINLGQKLMSLIKVIPGPVAAIAGALALGKAITSINKQIENHVKIINQGFAPTEDTVKKLNLEYEKTSEVLQKAKENMDALQKTGQALYRSNTNLGVSGVSLTIEEFDNLTQKVKSDFPDLIEVFNKAKPEEVLAKAEQIKAQFVSGGMSVKDATDFIYTLIKASNDANMALSAISSKGFQGILDSTSAAKSALKTFEKLALDLNIDQISEAFNTARFAIDQMKKGLIGTKDSTGKVRTEADALELTMKRLNDSSGINVELSYNQVSELKKQNVLLEDVLGTSETVQSVYAKTELYVRGITTGLKELSAEAAMAKLQLSLMVEAQLRSADGPFKSLAKQISNLEKSSNIEKITKQVQKTQDQIKKEIDLRKKNIEKIKEEADARLQALDREKNDEDAVLEIKKLQLQYQNQIASGQTEAAAQTAIDIQRRVGNQQSEFARRAIEDKANERIKIEENAIERLQKELDNAQKKINKADKSAQDAAKELARVQDLMDRSVRAVASTEGGIDKFERKIIEQLQKDLVASGFSDLASSLDPKERKIVRKGRGVVGTEIPEVSKLFEGQLQEAYDSSSKALRVTVVNPKEFFNTSGAGTSKNPISVPSSRYKDNTLTTTGEMKQIVEGEQLKAGQIFTFKGKKYEVQIGVDSPSSTRYVKKLYTGGQIKGPGTGTSDSIPAMLSNGEYVIKQSAVKQYGVSFFDAINNQKFAAGGYANVPKYADGGYMNIPKFQNGINMVPADMIAMLHKNEAVVPANMNPFNPNSNGTIGTTIMVDKVVMKFPDTPTNGKEMFMEFKEAMRVENLKKGGTVII